MRTGFLGLLLLVSSSALAYETTCKSSEIKIKYLGHSKLQFQQKLLDGLDEELRLVAFHQSLGAEEQSVPGDALETFAVSFEGKEKASGKQVRFKVYESGKYQLIIENELGDEIQSYSGKCESSINKKQAKQMLQDIRQGNRRS